MTILYLDATAGIAGDMTVAALLDLGLSIEYLHNELAKLGLPDGAFTISDEQVQRGGVVGRTFIVHLPHGHNHNSNGHHHHHRCFSDIRTLIAVSGLSERVKQLAQRIFLRLAEAEALAHQVSVDEVTFHEVGAVDSIVDIVAISIGLDLLGVDQIYTSAVPLGGGFVKTAHGILPVPAPATTELLKELMIHTRCGDGERVTPTGAAVLAALAMPVRLMPDMIIAKVGYGAGTKDFPDCPNILRAFLGRAEERESGDEILELSCNIDDVTPEVLGYTMERLLQAGALDVWHTSIQMKKSRPGSMISLLCLPGQQRDLVQLIMVETGALGVRTQLVKRVVQKRQIEELQTSLGPARFKLSCAGCKPEYEDCCRIAREQDMPLREVQRLLLREYGNGQ
jgi:uncharacterized protein (TIGR00299 family) protein